MTLITLSLILTAACAPVTSAPPQRDQTIEIDGKKNPEMIPDHVLWKHVFRFFASNSGMPSDLRHTLETRDLPMPAADYELLRDYADKHAATEAALTEPVRRLQEQFTQTTNTRSRSEIRDQLRTLELEQRFKTLQLADALLLALSDQGRIRLLEWTQDFKTDISISVPRSDLEFFRRPR